MTHRVAGLIERLQYLEDKNGSSSDPDEEAEPVSVVIDENNKEEDGCFLDGASLKAPGSIDLLVKDLTLHLRPGRSLLITGSSSAGKTSLLRVLRGLWRLSRGSIRIKHAPGPQGVLFLPQKPYLTDGTLREQIVYPLGVDLDVVTQEETDQLLAHLSATKMDGLLERIGGLDRAVDWNWYDVLSPGEMQRLSFIRLLYHRPAMAFLDEATSAVDSDMEELLYSAAVSAGVTVVSVGHRDSLRAFHQDLLNLKGDGTWTLEPILDSSQPSTSF